MTGKVEKYLTSCQHCLFFHQHWKERSQRLQGLPPTGHTLFPFNRLVLFFRRRGAHTSTAGRSTSSHHWRKLVGVVDSGAPCSADRLPRPHATHISPSPWALASELPRARTL